MADRWKTVFSNNITFVLVIVVLIEFTSAFERRDFVFWPNGSIPFYVNPTHFDKEQSLAILSALSLFTFQSCLKFNPVMAEPAPNQHVMVFENPKGIRKCHIDMEGHPKEEPHRITLGYECLRSPQIELVIMKALGFPFEHNRAVRDVYIDVQFENIEPGAIPFFTKEKVLPQELRTLPYDFNSVMHFGEREYSKNGHRSIIFKNKEVQQSRIGLSKIDLRKIKLIYGPECQKRDRQAKIDICKKYPSVRRKREIDLDTVQNLRINREITPPPEKNLTDAVTNDIKHLNIDKEIQHLIEHIHKISAVALENERVKVCNNTRRSDNKNNATEHVPNDENKNVESNNIAKIIEVVVNHVKEVVIHAKTNLTVFCDETNAIEFFQRACMWGNGDRCPKTYKSTLSGRVKYSTKHRPIIKQFTKHDGRNKKIQYARSGNDTQEANNATRKKRDTEAINFTDLNKDTVSRTKRDIEILNTTAKPKDLITSDDVKVSTSTNVYTENSTNVVSVRRKRDVDTLILKGNTTSTTIKPNESTLVKEDDTVKENVTKIDESFKDVNANNSKDTLRIATRVFSDKKVNYAPFRRSHRELFGHSENIEKDTEEELNDSASSEKNKRKRTTKREVTVRNKSNRGRNRGEGRERERERPRENVRLKKRDRNSDRDEEDRPQKQRPKVKRGRPRPRLPETVALTKENKEFYSDRIWPDGVVRYVISQDTTYNLESVRARLEEVNDILKKKTCVRIEEVSDREGQKHIDYLVIDDSADYVTGRVGGKQKFGSMELFEGGQHRQHAAMMVMAMLGFYFEVSRHDRDKFIRVHNRHIRPDKLHHFEKIRSDATLNLPYDYASATHPAWQFWRRVGRTGISTVATYKDQDPDGSIMRSLGQNEQLLSNLDIKKINSVYGVQCFQNRHRMRIQTTSHSLVT